MTQYDTTKLAAATNSKIKALDNCNVEGLGSGAFPRYIDVKLPGDDGALMTALWDGSLNLAVNDKVICHEYGQNPILRIAAMGGGDSGAGLARVYQLWESDFGAVAVTVAADGKVGVGTTIPEFSLQVGDGANSIGLAAGNNIIFAGPNTTSGRFMIEGTGQADIIMIDGGAGANDKAMQIITDGGITVFRSLTDVAGVQTNHILVLDHSAVQVGIGVSAPASRLDLGAGAVQQSEMTAPGAGAANTVRYYAEDITGTTEWRAIFNGGHIVKLARDGGLATYTPTNVVTDRSYDANSTTVAELADVLGTLITDLQTAGVLG